MVIQSSSGMLLDGQRGGPPPVAIGGMPRLALSSPGPLDQRLLNQPVRLGLLQARLQPPSAPCGCDWTSPCPPKTTLQLGIAAVGRAQRFPERAAWLWCAACGRVRLASSHSEDSPPSPPSPPPLRRASPCFAMCLIGAHRLRLRWRRRGWVFPAPARGTKKPRPRYSMGGSWSAFGLQLSPGALGSSIIAATRHPTPPANRDHLAPPSPNCRFPLPNPPSPSPCPLHSPAA